MFWIALAGLLGGGLWLAYDGRAFSTRTLVAMPFPPAPPPPPAAVVVGEVKPTPQETLWTCGPAALRAVLGHYEQDVSERELENVVASIPALGTRPEGLVAGAARYGLAGRVTQLRHVRDLLPLLARGVPPIVIVDSWTRPGKVGHYVVVTDVDLAGAGRITLMDPHVAGNQRVLTTADFDARWWAKRVKDGQPIKLWHLTVVLAPEAPDVAVGAEPTGRTAHQDTGGWFGTFTSATQTIFRVAAKAMIEKTVGPEGAKAMGPLLDKLTNVTGQMKAKEFAAWINTASNADVALLAMAKTKGAVDKYYGKTGSKNERYLANVLTQLKIAPLDFADMDGAKMSVATLKYMLNWYNQPFFLPDQVCQHYLQALAFAAFGGDGAFKILMRWLKDAQRPKDWKSQAVAELVAYRDAPAKG